MNHFKFICNFIMLLNILGSTESSNVDEHKTNATATIWHNCPFCGRVQKTRIVGGRTASIRQFPWTVDIRKNGVQHCGGSVIRSNYILTAAHCVVGQDAKSFVVIASVTNILDVRAFKSKVASATSHPQFDPKTYDYDVAVLELEKTLPLIKGARIVCLSTLEDEAEGRNATVSGWGSLHEESHMAPPYFRTLSVPVVSNEDCKKAKGMEDQLITDRMLCAGYLKGQQDACSGDSGGPLVWRDRGIWKQVGIVSWGIGCARENYYGVYTRVASLLSWISQHTSQTHC